MKGQKTLAMIVSMVLIMIVITMVVQILQGTATGFKNSPVMDTEMKEARSMCSRRCAGIHAAEGEEARKKAVKYCAERIPIARERLGSGFNTFCGDGARCFNLESCSYRGTSLNASKCNQLLCDYFSDEKVNRYFEQGRAEGDFGLGTCELTGIEDSAGYNVSNWYTSYFQGGACG